MFFIIFEIFLHSLQLFSIHLIKKFMLNKNVQCKYFLENNLSRYLNSFLIDR